jgi:hypothetical protein
MLSLYRLKSESSGGNRLRYADRFSAAVEHELRNSDFDAKIISVGMDAGYDNNEISDITACHDTFEEYNGGEGDIECTH